ncbi:MetQ/NlpA family ABC transporter substrate-binding protein [Bacillus shivajii]|uniref:MetQ/NlpA family ABC transporter substrate-binding protein n=1 Tax=Bacillus shivajii TaxID=1983719 RepID=UPI001CFA2051|nr:MetQ/NlpA family ABC transporter substrate-binding protein [Bacillus shivajii]UCZ53988.1 MetQ/NlpA family ABC transporter substrate-binding protein [Bacillus shivajii]
MKKLFTTLTSIFTLTILLTACGGDDDTITVGVNGSGIPMWEFVAEKAEAEGINLEIMEFADYVRPNMALADGEIDINAFQTVSYFDNFIEEHNLDLVPIGSTLIAPMGLYSEKYTSYEEIPEGAEIAVPQEETNQGRALLLLEAAGFIELVDDFNGVGGVENIVSNPHDIEIVEIVAAQTPRVLPDVDASVINNGVAVEAGFIPVQDAIFIEDHTTAEPYINIIATQAERADDEVLQTIVELYQQEDTADHIREVYNDSLIPVFVDLDVLKEY